ncbi:MAG: Hydrolase of the metallo-beta-lactamase superfamily [Bacteriovoracaceae bacterium]|nr:Hydrolase of the metallo-beta-lactamase superfamily [Bacteriovoracaceae bacterium]
MTYANVFAYKNPSDWFTYHPFFIGDKFNYPFVTSLVSGLLMRLGFDRVPAFVLPSIVSTLFFLAMVYVFFRQLLDSNRKAFLATSLLLASGGLGFILFIQELIHKPSLTTLMFPPQEYTLIDSLGIQWGNIVTSQLIPQRAFLLGFPFALGIILFIFSWAKRSFKGTPNWKLCLLGFSVGILTLIHPHSVLAVAIICFFLFALEPRPIKPWLLFGSTSALFATVAYFLFLKAKTTQHFFGWHGGWMSDGTTLGFFKFWWINWGFFLPLAILGAWRTRLFKNPFVLSGFFIFVICNLIRFAPWIWDNTKLLTWSYLLLSIPVVSYLSFLWNKKNLVSKISAVLLIGVTTASGALELCRLSHTDQLMSVMWPEEDIKMANQFRSISQPTDRVLVGPDDFQSWVIRLSGRQVLLGYSGTVWSYGFDGNQLHADIREMLKGGDSAKVLLIKYDLHYVVIGDYEKTHYEANEAYFKSHFRNVLENSRHRVYNLKDPLGL